MMVIGAVGTIPEMSREHATDHGGTPTSREARLEAENAHHLRRRVEELQQAVRARDDFITIAAHELRNPMTPIIGMAEAALAAVRKAEGTYPPRVTTLLEHLQYAAQDFIRRATRLLDVGRIESGNLQLEPAATDLSELVRTIAQRYAVAAAHGRSVLELEVENGVCGLWDRLAAEEIVENLLSNALKFGMGRPVTLRLRSDGRSALLQVQDRGVGMPPDQQSAHLRAVRAGGGPASGQRLRRRPVGGEPPGRGDGRPDRCIEPLGRGLDLQRHASSRPPELDQTTHGAA